MKIDCFHIRSDGTLENADADTCLERWRAGWRSRGIGNVLDQGVDLFESPNLFENLFSLQGFDLQIGNSFVIDFLSGSTAPTSAFALIAFQSDLDFETTGFPDQTTLWRLLRR